MKNRTKTAVPALLAIAWSLAPAFAQETTYPVAKVSFTDFKTMLSEVEQQRETRLIDLDTFLRESKKEGVVILDSRSKFRFDRIHIKGARHLAFTDFTQESLAKTIPDFGTKILIYCNNNFEGNQTDFTSKVVLPVPVPASATASQIAAQEKPLMLALNIPTYINLHGYGYRNVYELHELVKVDDPRITFAGTTVSDEAISNAE